MFQRASLIDWRAYENDDLFFNYALGLGGSEGETANQTVNMAVPAGAGTNLTDLLQQRVRMVVVINPTQ